MLVTQQRGFHARPVKQDAPPAQPNAGNFAGRAPVEQRAAADWQPCQQLLLVNEAAFARQCLVIFTIHLNQILSEPARVTVQSLHKMICRILAQLAGFAPARKAGAGSKMRMQDVHHAEPKWAVVFSQSRQIAAGFHSPNLHPQIT